MAINDKYWFHYESQDSKYFIITHIKDGKKACFRRAPCGLHWIDTKTIKTGEDVEVLINNVEDSKISYTRRSYLQSKLSRKLQRIISRPTLKTLKRIIGRNLLTNCPVNIADVSAAEDIFGPYKGILHGNKVRTNPHNGCG